MSEYQEETGEPGKPEESEAQKLARRLSNVEGASADTWNQNPAEAKPDPENDIQLAAEDFKDKEQFNNFFPTAQDNKEHQELKYIGTIYNKLDGEDKKPLVHIKKDGSLICPRAETEEDRKLQATAIANSLLITQSKASPVPMPVIMKGFTAEELKPILDALEGQSDKIQIHLDPEHLKNLSDKEQRELKSLVETFNTSSANSKPLATLSTTQKQSAKQSQEDPQIPQLNATEKQDPTERTSSPPQTGGGKRGPDVMDHDVSTQRLRSPRIGGR